MIEHSSSWTSKLGRAGYAAKAATYTTIGILAGKAAMGPGGDTTGSKGAIQEIGSKPFGQVLLVLLIAGFLCYAAWRFIAALTDSEGKGTDAGGIATRVGYFVTGIIHLGLAYAAFEALGGGGSSGDSGAQHGTARLMSAPFGRWLVVAVGVGIIAAAIAQWVSAIKGSFASKFDLEGAAAPHRGKIVRVARIGISARGVVFALIGIFLIQAGWQADSGEARGLGGTLAEIQRQPFGPWLLGAAALGLLCYAIYCAVVAIYGELGRRARA